MKATALYDNALNHIFFCGLAEHGISELCTLYVVTVSVCVKFCVISVNSNGLPDCAISASSSSHFQI